MFFLNRMICDGLDNRVMTIHVIREKLLHFASILLQFATIVTTFCGVTGIFTRANVKLAAKW